MTIRSYYDILEIGNDASLDEIKRGYRKQVKRWHPDMPNGNERNFLLVKDAHDFLLDYKFKNGNGNGNGRNGHFSKVSSLEVYLNNIRSYLNQEIKRFDSYVSDKIVNVKREFQKLNNKSKENLNGEFQTFRGKVLKYFIGYRNGHLQYIKNLERKVPGIIENPIEEERMVKELSQDTFEYYKKLTDEETQRILDHINQEKRGFLFRLF